MSAAFPKVQLDLVASFTAQILPQPSNSERSSPDAPVSCPDHYAALNHPYMGEECVNVCEYETSLVWAIPLAPNKYRA